MNNYQPVERDKKTGIKLRYIFALMMLTFVGGSVLSIWAADRLDLFGDKTVDSASADVPAQVEAKPAFDSLSLDQNAAAANVGPVNDRVEDLEARLSRINIDAAAASGSANRAEGLLVAFAARRAIESGTELGYVANQLTERFGANQPQAVSMVLAAAENVVTLDQLRAELAADGNRWLAPSGMTIWEKFRNELSELFILRRETIPSPAPSRRLERAKQYAEVGNIAAALAEIKRLPGNIQANSWLKRAETYIAVRTALDKIEQSALTQPLSAPSPVLPSSNSAIGRSDEPITEQALPERGAVTPQLDTVVP